MRFCTYRVGRFAVVLLCSLAPSGCASHSSRASGESCGEPIAVRDNVPRELTVLAEDLSPVRSTFNSSVDRWRVIALVSPTCSECVLGAEAVQQEIAARYPASQVSAIIVWIPMLESDNERVARASATIFPPQRAAQFYDAQQAVGWGYARHAFAGFVERARTSLPEGHRLTPEFEHHRDAEGPQWDLYMLYAPGVRWTEQSPPMPTHWIRHVGRGEDRKTSTYWRDTPESGPREGDLFEAMRDMADDAIRPVPPG